MAEGKSRFENLLESADTQAALEVARGLKEGSSVLFSGDSGITTTFALALLGVRRNAERPVVLDCGVQMKQRSLKPLVDALRQRGMTIKGDHCPLTVCGALKGGEVTVEGLNSQYASALLMALPMASGNSVLHVKNLRERPYVAMTLEWLRRFGMQARLKQEGSEDVFYIPGGQRPQAVSARIPGDYSSASCLLVAAALFGKEVQFEGLEPDDMQADRALLELLVSIGAGLEWKNGVLTVRGGRKLEPFTFDVSDCPDLFPAVATLAAYVPGSSVTGTKGARHKETDRVASMEAGLRALGGRLCGYGDHRTVMALTVAALGARGESIIDTAESVAKTYPDFFKDLRSLGAGLRPLASHLVLIGFKGSGKSSLGRSISEKLKQPFCDLDDAVAERHRQTTGNFMTCREIMKECGEKRFRALEHEALKALVAEEEPHVIALGGGTPFSAANQRLLKGHTVVHVKAPKSLVRERILKGGRPAFFPTGLSESEAFDRLWQERLPVYKKLATLSLQPRGSLAETADLLISRLPLL